MQVRLCERAAYTPPCLREEAGRWRVCTGTAVDLLKTAVRMFLRMVRGPLAATVIRACIQGGNSLCKSAHATTTPHGPDAAHTRGKALATTLTPHASKEVVCVGQRSSSC